MRSVDKAVYVPDFPTVLFCEVMQTFEIPQCSRTVSQMQSHIGMQLLHSQRRVAQLTSPATIGVTGNPTVRLYCPQYAATEGCSFDRRVCGGHRGSYLCSVE
jgi:hypothetical protein